MMNPFLLTPRERLADWKKLRETLSTHPEREQLDMVAKYWAQAPVATFAYDADDPSSWPTAWEMISEGDWCRNSVAIGMEFTLRLSGWDAERLKLIHWHDFDLSDRILVLQVDAKYLLNFEYGEVVDVPNTRHDVISAWQFSKRGFEQTVA